MGMRRRGNSGNLALTVVLFLVLGVGVILFVLNYSGLFQTHYKGNAATDAAALEGAKLLSRVAIVPTGGAAALGQVGMVDCPGNSPNHPAEFADLNSGARLQKSRPVVGINTLMASVRLNLLVAERLGNQRMKTLAQDDLGRLREATRQLAEKVRSAEVMNAIRPRVKDVFLANNPQKAVVVGEPRIFAGRLESEVGTTNIRVPRQAGPLSPVGDDNVGGNYKPYKAYDTFGVPLLFTAVADSPALVDSKRFNNSADLNGVPVIPSVVKVEFDTRVSGYGEAAGQKVDGQVTFASAAEMGSPVLPNTSTAYTVGFVGGLPPDKTFGGKNRNEVSAKDIMNNGSAFTTDLPGQDRTWLQSPPNPGAGGPVGSPPLAFTKFDYPVGGTTEPKTNPSDALADGVYFWIKSMGLRPDFETLCTMLETPFEKLQKENPPKLSMGGRHNNSWRFPRDLMQPAMAKKIKNPGNAVVTDDSDDPVIDFDPDDDGDDDVFGMVTCTHRPPGEGEQDPRYEALTDGSGTVSPDAEAFLGEVFGYKSLGAECPEESVTGLFDPVSGKMTTMNGEQVAVLCRLVEGTIATSRAANVSRYGGLLATRVSRLKKQDTVRATNLASRARNFLNNRLTARFGPLRTALSAIPPVNAEGRQDKINAYNAQVDLFNKLVAKFNGQNGTLDNSAETDGAETGDDNSDFIFAEGVSVRNKFNDKTKEYSFDNIVYGTVNGVAVVEEDKDLKPLPEIPAFANDLDYFNDNISNKRSKKESVQEINDAEQEIPALVAQIQPEIDILKVQTIKWTEVRKRARASRFNGVYGHNRCVRLLKRIKRWTANGAEQLYKPNADQDGLMFVVNFGGNGGSNGAPRRSPRLINLLPDNEDPANPENTIERRTDPNHEHFFDISPFTGTECAKYARTLTNVQIFPDKGDQPAALTNEEKLKFQRIRRSGAKYVVQVSQAETGNDFIESQEGGRILEEEKSRWDVYKADRPRYIVGLHFIRRYNKKSAGEFEVPLETLRGKFDDALRKAGILASNPGLVRPARHNSDWFFPSAEAETVDLGANTPKSQMVFTFTIKGDFQSGKGDGGKVAVTYLGGLEKLPFQNNKVLPGQLLYFAGNSLQQGDPQDPNSQTLRSVIARNQVFDGNALNNFDQSKLDSLQSPRDWCEKSQGFGFNYNENVKEGETKPECPRSAGEWRIGPAISIACCSLDLSANPFGKRPERRASRGQIKKLFHKPVPRKEALRADSGGFVELEDLNEENFLDPGEPGDPVVNLEEDDVETCPQIPKRFG